jgi:Fe-S-cluster containining protein
MNECGTCTLCCRLTEVPELSKPLNQWCKSCNPSQGCSIYESRPESCRKFRCVWLLKGLHENLRPDRSKVIFEMLSNKTFLAVVHPNYSDSWKKGLTLKLIREILNDGISVVIITPGQQSQFLLSKDRTSENMKEELDMALKVHNEMVNEWQQHPIQKI